MDSAHPNWQVLYISEVDGKLSHSSEAEPLLFGGTCSWKRYWPGHGAYAQAVVFRSTFTPYIRNIQVRGRCIWIHASDLRANSPATPADTPLSSVHLFFIHGSHVDVEGTLGDLSVLLRLKKRMSQAYVMGDFNIDLLPQSPADPFAENERRDEHHRDRRMRF